MIFNVSKENRYKVGVYTIVNKVNNKIYIGSTGNCFYNRYHQHISDYKKGKYHSPIMRRAFDKYSIDNFEFSILEICDKKEDCIELEQWYLDNFKTDYNACKIAGSLLGFKHPATSKTRMVTRGNHHSALGVDKYTIKGEFVESYTSIIEAKEDNNIKCSTNISSCCVGKIFSIGGFRWAYTGNKLSDRVRMKSGKKVINL